MKIKINPEKELFKWGPLEFKLIYGSPFLNCILSEIKKYYPWPWATGVCLSRMEECFGYKNNWLLI